MDYLLPILFIIIFTPVAYFGGYKLRPYISKRRRFTVGIIVSVAFPMLFGLLSLVFFSVSNILYGLGLAFGIGSSLGLAQPEVAKLFCPKR